MKPFSALTHSGQITRLKRLAGLALAEYDLGDAGLKPLLHLENTTFRVTAQPGGEKYVLRVCRPGYQNLEAIRSEMQWLAALRQETDLGVPEPVQTRDGAWLTVTVSEGVPEPRTCVLVRWVEGRFIKRNFRPVHLERVGAFMARLHDHATGWTTPQDFTRQRWDGTALVGKWLAGDLGPGEILVSAEGRAIFEAAATRIQEEVAALSTEPEVFGLIHADLHHGNVLFHKQVARAIDFDDCGWGYHLYDMAVTLWPLERQPEYAALRAAFLDGYAALRPLPDGHRTMIASFIAARHLAITSYILGRADNPKLHEWAPLYVKSAMGRLREYLDVPQIR